MKGFGIMNWNLQQLDQHENYHKFYHIINYWLLYHHHPYHHHNYYFPSLTQCVIILITIIIASCRWQTWIVFFSSGYFPPGMNAILGPTGCGKTSWVLFTSYSLLVYCPFIVVLCCPETASRTPPSMKQLSSTGLPKPMSNKSTPERRSARLR